MPEYITYGLVLLKHKIIEPESDEFLNQTNSLEEVHRAEEYIKLHKNESVNKITSVGNSTSQTTQFLQKINYKGRKRVRRGKTMPWVILCVNFPGPWCPDI